MAIKTTTLIESTRTVSVQFNGDSADVTYRLGALNQDFWSWYGENVMKEGSLSETIERLVKHWDVLDDSDEPIPATVAQIKQHRIPVPFLRCVQQAIFEDAQPGKLSASASNAGSPRVEKSARSRRGTRG